MFVADDQAYQTGVIPWHFGADHEADRLARRDAEAVRITQ
jgi:hypothetical protein